MEFNNKVAVDVSEVMNLSHLFPHGYIWLNRSGEFQYVDKRVSQSLGYASLSLFPKTIFEVFPYLNFMDWRDFWKALRHKGHYITDFKRGDFDKKPESYAFSASLIKDENDVEYCCAFFQKKGMGIAPKVNVEKEAELIQNFKICVFYANKRKEITYGNDAICKLLKYQKDEFLNLDLDNIFADKVVENEESTFTRLVNKDGDLQNVRLFVQKLSPGTPDRKFIYFAFPVSDNAQRISELEHQLKDMEEQLKDSTLNVQEQFSTNQNFEEIITVSPAYHKVLHQVEQVATTDATVLIMGETGTGKELLAKAIHRLSNRADRPMVMVNCGALPPNLIESELFGHEKGAFTGAHQMHIGRFERANKGTIFLDEIGELPLDLQSKLLRVLQEGEFEKVGANKTQYVNVRIIAATNRNLQEQVENGNFREDLFYRLNVFPIVNIPLRERPEDIPVLVNYFVEKYNRKMGKNVSELPQHALKKLKAYPFPGNIRELENLIERAVILASGKVLRFDAAMFESGKKQSKSVFLSMDELQRQHILEALRKTGGKVSGKKGAAALLKMNDKTLTSRMNKYNIERYDYKRMD